MEDAGNGLATVDYEKRARSVLVRVWDERTIDYPPKMWAALLMGQGVVYALLEIARAIRDARS